MNDARGPDGPQPGQSFEDWLKEQGFRAGEGIGAKPFDDDTDEASRAFLRCEEILKLTVHIPARRWLLGTTFCRGYVSGVIAAGDSGKTAGRIAQGLSVASGRPLSGEHVFERVPVLYVTLEDDALELQRRVRAALIHHQLAWEDVREWFHILTPSHSSLRLGSLDAYRQFKPGFLRGQLAQQIEYFKAGLVIVDPLIKAHQVPENSNELMDLIVGQLAGLAQEYDCDMDFCHHVHKGSEAGNQEASRGASAITNAARLVQMLTRMSTEEAETYKIPQAGRRYHVRVDAGKANIARAPEEALWLRLVSVALGNYEPPLYPHGDHVQAAEAWTPPEVERFTSTIANRILNVIDAGVLDDTGVPSGQRYCHGPAANRADAKKQAWRVVKDHAPMLSDANAKAMIKTWVKNGVLVEVDYDDAKERKSRRGLSVNAAKRPGAVS
jgi:hypothetical protein